MSQLPPHSSFTLRRILFPLVGAALWAGCTDGALEDDAVRDPNAPEVKVIEPARGLLLVGDDVRVRGKVFDDGSGVDRVEINGVVAELHDGGVFFATVPLSHGMNLLETVAYDAAGNESRDTRALISGEFTDREALVENAMSARIDAASATAAGAPVSTFLTTADFTEMAQKANPVYDGGGSCLGARVNIDSVERSLGTADIALADGGIAFNIVIDDLVADLTVDWDVACLGGDAGIHGTADKAYLSGVLELSVVDGEMIGSLRDAQFSFDNFDMDVGIVPSEIVGLIPNLDGLVAGFLLGQIENSVPAITQAAFGLLSSGELSVPVFDRSLDITMVATRADFSATEAWLGVQTNMQFSGSSGPGFIATPKAAPSDEMVRGQGDGMRFSMADDALNQVMSSLWTAGVLSRSIDVGEIGGSGLGGVLDRVDLNMLLPPAISASASGDLSIEFGDLIVDIVKLGDGVEKITTRLAVSGRLKVEPMITADNKLSLRTSVENLWVDVVEEGVDGANLLATDTIEVLATHVVGQVSGVLDGMLGAIPMPAVGGTVLAAPSVSVDIGYLFFGAGLE